ncbi:MAG: Gfo/Idh/MocA family protein [Planctomycetota bacterium]|jgi:predicted dehydrogenase
MADTKKTLKIAAIGLSERAEELLDIAWESNLYTIVAVGDERADQAEVGGRKYDCAHFTDFRQLIIQTEADFLLFGEPIHQCAESVRLAIGEGFSIMKTFPPSLNFEQLAEFFRLAKKQGTQFIVAQNGRFARSFEQIRQHLSQSDETDKHEWHLISAICHVPTGELEPEKRWLYDPTMAGGGVLMHHCYDLIDELLLCFGLPQRVYALAISQAPDRQQRMSLTEDTAVVTMQFTDTLIAQICASRTLGPARRHLRVHGKGRHLTATEEEVVVYDNSGELLEQQSYPQDRTPAKKRMMENLAGSILTPTDCPLYPEHRFDLNTLAVIEAAYLSARTGMAEDPSRIMSLADIDATGLL